MKKLLKRYQHWTKNGKEWTEWFPVRTSEKQEYQLYDRRISSRLLNEYKEV